MKTLAFLVLTLLSPTRIVWTDGPADNCEHFLRPYCGQVSTSVKDVCTMRTGSAVLLDFGCETHGGIRITTAIRGSKVTPRIRIRFGESVSEAMSDVGSSTATNEHSMRDFEVGLPWLGSFATGDTGFRFVRIDVVDDGGSPLPLAAVQAESRTRDIPQRGSFTCSDPRLNEIWTTAVRTVHLNMQDYVWDGIKRDRLVWIGDMHPEVMTISYVYGSQDVVRRSLDFVRDNTPLDVWMNGICSYTMWWIIIQRDLYLHTGDLDYLAAQHQYIAALLRKVASCRSGNREDFRDGRFIDWPTSRNDTSIHQCLQAMLTMTMRAGVDIATALKDRELCSECLACLDALSTYVPEAPSTKQAAAFLSLAGLMSQDKAAEVISAGGPDGFSTFTGFYMLEALSNAGKCSEAMDITSRYWGGMLDLGATTFWEDLKYSDLADAGRIDQIVPEGKYDIHQDGGDFCYVGLRLSLCHGWASGPAPWMLRHILGVTPIEPGFAKVSIRPSLGSLDWAEGDVPTPKGIIHVRADRRPDGTISVKYSLPRGVRISR